MELRAESGRREAARTATKRDGEVDWKAQHERRVAERRERTEHERIEAEKLQQVSRESDTQATHDNLLSNSLHRQSVR